MRKIKVVFFAEILVADFDGASRTMFQLIDRIDPDRFDFLFVCGSGPEKINQFDCIVTPSFPILVNPKYKLALPSLTAEKIQRKLDRFKPDVVHISTPSLLGHFGLRYARKHAIPVISIYHTHFLSYINYYLKYIPVLIRPVQHYLKSIQNQFYGSCQKIYIPSVTIADELKNGGMAGDKFKIWQRGISMTLFSPTKRSDDFVMQLTGNDRPTILFASRLVWEKNLETLIAIYANMRERGFDYNWVIVGDGIARNECSKRMPTALFLGHLDHESLSVLYASASVFIFPSVSETFGNVVLEAMASGLVPVIADAGGSADLVTSGFNGYACKGNDPDEYVKRLVAIIEDDALRQTLSRNAVASSRAFDWDELARVYFQDLQELVGSVTENQKV